MYNEVLRGKSKQLSLNGDDAKLRLLELNNVEKDRLMRLQDDNEVLREEIKENGVEIVSLKNR